MPNAIINLYDSNYTLLGSINDDGSRTPTTWTSNSVRYFALCSGSQNSALLHVSWLGDGVQQPTSVLDLLKVGQRGNTTLTVYVPSPDQSGYSTPTLLFDLQRDQSGWSVAFDKLLTISGDIDSPHSIFSATGIERGNGTLWPVGLGKWGMPPQFLHNDLLPTRENDSLVGMSRPIPWKRMGVLADNVPSDAGPV